MNFQLIERKYGYTLKAEGIEVDYTKRSDDAIVRSEAVINGYRFELDRASEFRGWKKVGRGGIKQKKEVEAILVAADSFMFDAGYGRCK
jgi:hypothetical protein